jgi:cob(I)alamin adenosyltransferase
MTSIRTGQGDQGKTRLFSKEQVSKDHPRILALGTLDELSAHVGMAVSLMKVAGIPDILQRIQQDLLTMGSDLATTDNGSEAIQQRTNRITHAHVDYLEATLHDLERQLPQLTQFILPGGRPSAAALHVARAVCRRAESNVVVLMQEEYASVDGMPSALVLVYLNILSDYLFQLARWVDENDYDL